MNFKLSVPLVLFTFILLIFSSGCVDFGGTLGLLGLTPTGPNYTVSENILVSSEVYPREVYEGKNTVLYFSLSNDGNITISDFNLEFTDLCEFEDKELKKTIDEIEPGEYEEWSWEITAKESDVIRDCSLRYDVSYESSSRATYDIAAISENEQQRLLKEGKMEEIDLNYFRTKSPVEIDISLSKEQPILEGSSFYLYIDLTNVGSGYLEKINKGEASIEYPRFLELESCDDYDSNGNLKRDLDFISGRTKRSTCKFKVREGTVIRDIGRFEVQINYKYMYHKTINVRIKPD